MIESGVIDRNAEAAKGNRGPTMHRPGIVRARVQKVRAGGGGAGIVWDLLAAEEPLEIRIGVGPEEFRRVETPRRDDEDAGK